MTARIIKWTTKIEPLGSCVVAIGVFDGVHLGHQALLRTTVADAAARQGQAVAVTFDRDPDQVVSPQSAAPQLLTLDDKLRAISRTGVDSILVVPFTHDLAALSPEAFLDSVLLRALSPLAIHVGSDFRFGAKATGDVTTLQAIGADRGFDVVPHSLVMIGGQAVTSTRIRGLVAAGDIAGASQLLGGHPCVSGVVHRGRGEGAGLGFPTANVVPAQFAALPGDGVYAGRVGLADGSTWAAAVSVGTPPMFPHAKDYLEAHVLGFDGDLYDQPIVVEFWARLRAQERYSSLDELKAAIGRDAHHALQIAGFPQEVRDGDVQTAADSPGLTSQGFPASWETDPDTVPVIEDSAEADDADYHLLGDEYIDDPAALEAAEQAAMQAPDSFTRAATGEWKQVLVHSFAPTAAATESASITLPLDRAQIPYAWDPFPPESVNPSAERGGLTQPFTLLVPAANRAQARELLGMSDEVPLVSGTGAAQAGEWVAVLAGLQFNKRALLDIDAALDSADIDHMWHPYPPQDAPLLRLGIFNTERFSVSVEAADIGRAKGLLEGLDLDPTQW